MASESRAEAWTTATRETIRLVVLGTGPAPRLVGKGPLLVDLDMLAPDHVRFAKQALSAWRGERIFLLRGVNRLAEAQAAALGASRIVRPSELAALIAPPVRTAPKPVEDPSPALGSVDRGMRALESSFAGMATGATIDPAAILETGRAMIGAIETVGILHWLDTVRDHHSGTYQHCLLVTGLAIAFARAAGLAEPDALSLAAAGLVHDIGKARVPLALLDKPGRLSLEERLIMQAHAVHGSLYLQRQDAFTPEIRDMVRHHHEYLDGSGYPDRLVADQIPTLTRMLTIADVFGAMVEKRAYKHPVPPMEAYAALVGLARQGKLDAALVDAFRPVAESLAVQG
ncbi:HD-GYP domain-containing protein [Prosthecomicrobium sp. N25]|uniref:HD-GYP domain-containing protein n=1 Tax=Prosthecomicrobium sp. N25 TaxID=3129254 RepID=UPI003076F31D